MNTNACTKFPFKFVEKLKNCIERSNTVGTSFNRSHAPPPSALPDYYFLPRTCYKRSMYANSVCFLLNKSAVDWDSAAFEVSVEELGLLPLVMHFALGEGHTEDNMISMACVTKVQLRGLDTTIRSLLEEGMLYRMAT